MMSDYERIADAISFIVNRVELQPTLNDIAAHVHLSPFHFQRLFSRWVGVTPKRFLQVLTLERAKQLLSEARPLLEVSDTLGLSSGSRLYDHFVQLEAVTPGEYKLGGAGLNIEYGVHDTPFGTAFIAITPRGICSFVFLEHADINEHLTALQKKWLAGFYKKLTPAFLAKAKSIVTVSGFAKSVLIDHYKINADRVDVICPGVDEIFKPMDWDEKEVIKEKKADGKAYFLFSGDINSNSNHINLLKAFSFFKKRQKSNMMLLIAGRADEQFVKDLKTYKFRDEVKLLENLSTEELAKITAAAYAMVYPVFYSDLALPALQAMKCNTPLIVSNTCALPSICGNATLYCNPGDFKDIAENLMLVFKDEDKVKELVAAGKVQIQKHNWENAAAKLMQSIQKAFDN